MAHTAFGFTLWVRRSSELWHILSTQEHLQRGLVFSSNTTTLPLHELYLCTHFVCFQGRILAIQQPGLCGDRLRICSQYTAYQIVSLQE
jgi:hypothetical protein